MKATLLAISILALGLLLGLQGCGRDDNSTATSTDTPAAVKTPTQESASAEETPVQSTAPDQQPPAE